jgi:hypothetical protein
MAEIVYALFNASMPTPTRVGVLKDGGDPAAPLAVEVETARVTARAKGTDIKKLYLLIYQGRNTGL